jgi:hypothetical protein
MLNRKKQTVQSIVKKEIKPNPQPLLDVNIKVNNLKSAKRLLGKLISRFISGEIENQDAKDLAYLVSVYVSVVKDAEIEQRIKSLEEKFK